MHPCRCQYVMFSSLCVMSSSLLRRVLTCPPALTSRALYSIEEGLRSSAYLVRHRHSPEEVSEGSLHKRGASLCAWNSMQAGFRPPTARSRQLYVRLHPCSPSALHGFPAISLWRHQTYSAGTLGGKQCQHWYTSMRRSTWHACGPHVEQQHGCCGRHMLHVVHHACIITLPFTSQDRHIKVHECLHAPNACRSSSIRYHACMPAVTVLENCNAPGCFGHL